jgi:hypothetical protein
MLSAHLGSAKRSEFEIGQLIAERIDYVRDPHIACKPLDTARVYAHGVCHSDGRLPVNQEADKRGFFGKPLAGFGELDELPFVVGAGSLEVTLTLTEPGAFVFDGHAVKRLAGALGGELQRLQLGPCLPEGGPHTLGLAGGRLALVDECLAQLSPVLIFGLKQFTFERLDAFLGGASPL